jgi:hypothetical protein
MLTLIVLLVMAVISTVLIRKILAQRTTIKRLRTALLRTAHDVSERTQSQE